MWRSIRRGLDALATRLARPGLAARCAACALGLAGGAAQAALEPPPPFGPPRALPAESAEALGTPELLAIRLNGVEHAETAALLRLADGLAMHTDTWTALNLRAPAAAPLRHEGGRYHRLADAALRWQVDAATQTLVIDAPPAAFVGGAIGLDAPPVALDAAAAFGGYLNYDLQWQRSGFDQGGHQASASALLELGAFGGGGSGRLTGLLRDGTNAPRWVRLDTSWTVDRPERLASLRVGDAIGKAGAWGRALRFGGVQWATDFAVQPGFLSFPLPSLRGEAALPSTVDVYVDNSRRVQREVPAGAFDLTEVPIVTGQGQLRMVVRDLLGREQVVVQPYYVSPSLLRPGLRAFSYELGAVREDYGLESFRYGRLYAAATERHGVRDDFTRELRAELHGRNLAAGATGLWLLPAVGMVNASAVASHGAGGSGLLLAAAAERQAAGWSGSVQARAATRDFAQAGQRDGGAPRRHLAAAFATRWGGQGVGVSAVEQRGWDGSSQRLLALNTSLPVGGFGALGLFAQRDLANGGWSVSLSFSRALDERTSASSTATRSTGEGDGGAARAYANLQLQRSLPEGEPGFGWRLAGDGGDFRRASAEGAWQTGHAVFSAGVARSDGAEDARAGVSGGLAWLGDSLFLSRRIEGSFAVVEVGDYPGVQVLHDQRPVARTDARGRALLPGLRGYEANRVGIDPADLPFDAEVDAFETVVTPPARSGVAVRLAVQRSRAASFRLVGADGAALPPGSELQVLGQVRRYAVGYDGRAFVAGLGGDATLRASWAGQACEARLALPPAGADELPELGTLECR